MISRRDYEARVRRQARAAFAEHVLRCNGVDPHGLDRWCAARHRDSHWDSAYSFEAVCLRNRSLYVGGDIDHVVFAYGPADAIGRLAWIAGARGEYLREKASIGGSSGLVDWEREVAEHDLATILGDEQEPVARACGDELSAALRDGQHGWLRAVEDAGPDSESALWSVGSVPGSRLLYAQEAVARLFALITGKQLCCSCGEDCDGIPGAACYCAQCVPFE
jgi:hypothetical protein